MIKYIFRRLLQIIPVLLMAIFVVFCIMELAPGNPARSMLGNNATPEAIIALQKKLGLNDPLIVRYVRYIINMFKGDFGISYASHTPVKDEIISRFPITLKLAIGCDVVAILIGISLGVLAAVKQYSIADFFSTGFALALAAVPDFWLGMMLMLVFSVKLNLFPVTGADTPLHFILPVFALAAYSIALLIRMTRSSMLEVVRQDYITTAKAKGLSDKNIIIKHELHNAFIPIVTEIGKDIGGLMCGTVLIENVFSMPGLGTYMIAGVRNQDVPVVMASTTVLVIIISIVNLIVDISYAFIDPRMKSEFN